MQVEARSITCSRAVPGPFPRKNITIIDSWLSSDLCHSSICEIRDWSISKFHSHFAAVNTICIVEDCCQSFVSQKATQMKQKWNKNDTVFQNNHQKSESQFTPGVKMCANWKSRKIRQLSYSITFTLPLLATDDFAGSYMASAAMGGKINSPTVTARRA